MGNCMDSGSDNLLPKTKQGRKALVDNKETTEQELSTTAIRTRGLNWTEILARHGLESPGYRETFEKMQNARKVKG